MNKLKQILSPYFFLISVFLASSLGVIGKEFVNGFFIEPEPSLEEHRNTFINNCTSESGEEELCTCVFDQAIVKYGFDEFKKNNHLLISKGKDAVDSNYLKALTEEIPQTCRQKIATGITQNQTISDNLTNTPTPDGNKIFNFDDLYTEEEQCRIKSDNFDILAENERYSSVVNEMIADGLELSNEQISQMFKDNEEEYREEIYKTCLNQ